MPVLWQQLIGVAIGSALGGCCRFLLVTLSQRLISGSFPFGTITVNILGSFLMGWLFMFFLMQRPVESEIFRLFLLTGFLGGFTTFSAFSLDAWLLYEKGQMSNLMLYITLSVLISFIALVAGLVLARWLFSGAS